MYCPGGYEFGAKPNLITLGYGNFSECKAFCYLTVALIVPSP
jgi:hypothetical protein